MTGQGRERAVPGAVDGGRADGLGEVRDRFRGALVGVVVGDAVGAPLEGHPGPVPDHVLDAVERDGRALRYTDDSALTFAMAESLLARGRLDVDHLAAAFAATYARDPHRGYGGGAAGLLRGVARGDDWRVAAGAQFGGQGSFGNGAAMRVAPIALHAFGAVDVVVSLARRSATVTHTHPEGVDGAGVQAAAVALALSSGPDGIPALVRRVAATAQTPALRAALERVADLPEDASPAHVAAVTGTGVSAAEAVPAAIAAARLNARSFGDTIRFAMRMGGDVDTIASMAGAVSGASLGEGAIAERWLYGVEGVQRARELADRLFGQQGRRGRQPS